MITQREPLTLFLLIALAIAPLTGALSGAEFASHSPPRPLPTASKRLMDDGPAKFVDAAQGSDQADGTKQAPWKTLTYAATQLTPGDTLYLRGGVYFEHPILTCVGSSDQPITIRGYPGEIAVINGGLREFAESPTSAWKPLPQGAAGEYVSTNTFPDISDAEGCNVMARFNDSYVPLLGYRLLNDLRDNSMLWDLSQKTGAEEAVYCGPGVWYNPETDRIHIRLAATTLKALGDDNYRGETDPRKLSLTVAGINTGPALTLTGCSHVNLQDLVICGSRTHTLQLSDSSDLRCDRLHVYGGYSPMGVSGVSRLRIYHTACRGAAAPWTFRGHLKYRSVESRLFSASSWTSNGNLNQDFEIAYSEFTDSVDGVFIGGVKNVHFHHNLVDHVSDDGIFLTSGTAYDGATHGGQHYIYQNRLARCLTTFAFGVGHGRQKMTPTGRQTGDGVWIARNVFDFRSPVHYQMPAASDERLPSYGRVFGDHGSPLWEPMNVYHNTIVERSPMRRTHYLADMAGGIGGGSYRRLFNNIAVQAIGSPGKALPPVTPPAGLAPAKPAPSPKPKDPLGDLLDDPLDTKTKPKKPAGLVPEGLPAKKKVAPPLAIDFQADGNLHWGIETQPSAKSLLGAVRNAEAFAASKQLYAPGWTHHDLVVDPQLASVSGEASRPLDLRLANSSPAIDAGVPIPQDWIDPLRATDQGQPDIGAIPHRARAWRVGIQGRMTVDGNVAPATGVLIEPVAFPQRRAVPQQKNPRKVAIVKGYPAFDGPLIRYAMKKHGLPNDLYDRVWLPTDQYAKYGVVIVLGDLARAKMEPNRYTPKDLENVRAFLQAGGRLIVMRAGLQVFSTQHGQVALEKLKGASPRRSAYEMAIQEPDHPWVKHLANRPTPLWLNKGASPLRQSTGVAVIGTDNQEAATLLQQPVGKGQLVYIGWTIAAALPPGRSASTVEQEEQYEQQMQLLEAVLVDVCR